MHTDFKISFFILQLVIDNNKYYLSFSEGGNRFEEQFSKNCIIDVYSSMNILIAISLYKNMKNKFDVSLYLYESGDSINQKLLQDFEIESIQNDILSNILSVQNTENLLPREISLQSLRSTETYKNLCEIQTSDEGNLLQTLVNVKTANAQISFFNYALNRIKDEDVEGCLLEVGTNRGFFGYIASAILGKRTLHTFDINMESSKVVPILSKVGMDVIFNCGDSTKILNDYRIDEPVAFAWIDGGHNYEEAISDLRNAARLGAKYIAVDDIKFFAGKVNVAYIDFLTEHPEYINIDNPYWEHDDVGIAWCKLLD